METENKTLGEVLDYFIEIIKETQKNGCKRQETIACLIDLHTNALNTLEQIGGTEKEQIYIRAMIYDCFKKMEEEKLKSLFFKEVEGASHE